MNRRRLALTTLAAGALVLAPTAALAYDAPGYGTTTQDAAPAAGESVTLRTEGTTPGQDYTITVTSEPASLSNDSIQIAGTKSATKTATGTSVTFTVTFAAGGTYTAAVKDESGRLVGDQVFTVASSAAAAAAGTSALGATGFDGVELAVGAGALVLAGAGAVVVA
ncbi:peptidase, partial [Actinotalea ferrariae]|uniref:peptidase n=1 Tax=Actinotalea ferrariae TaxID=1386098 RepID=UPI001C8BD554